MIIDEYRKKQKVLEQELERLKEEYNMPDDYFENPEVSREIINNQIKSHNEDIESNKEYIRIYDKLLDLIEEYDKLDENKKKESQREILSLKDNIPKELADEIYECMKDISDRKSKEKEVYLEISNDIEKNISNYSDEFIKSENKNILTENDKSDSENILLDNENNEEKNDISLKENIENTNISDSIDLQGLDKELETLLYKLNSVRNEINVNSDNKELQEKYNVIKENCDGVKFKILELLDAYKTKFDKKYEELNLVYEGDEILLRKYKNDPDKISKIQNRLDNINIEKQKCFNNQNKIEELINKYTNISYDKIEKKEKNNKLLKVERVEHKPKLTWKTVVGIAAGIGAGSLVHFTLGPIGTIVLNATAGLTKGYVSRKRATTNIDYNKEKIKVSEVSGLSNKLKVSFGNLKKYLKSNEGLRDISWFLTSAIITSTALSVGSSIKNYISLKKAPSAIVNPSKETPATFTPRKDVPEPLKPLYNDIKIKSSVGDYNVSRGYDKATWALNKTNQEPLISEYVNRTKSIFNKFVVLNPDGSIGAQCTTPGMSISEFAKSQGVDLSRIAVLVSDKLGTGQAWTTTGELVKSMGGIR